MCGIYGSTKEFSERMIRDKLERISFRGPEFSKFINFRNKVIFGHNRLSIIDLDIRSNQPFSYKNVHIVLNGEIYNYLDIKDELIRLGYSFSTTSDTEVVCVAYLKWGENCLEKFNGMFSFVIYDELKNILFGARDRLGKKPFYYIYDGKDFEFASQPSQLAIGNKLTINQKAISQFLTWHYVPDPDSIYNEVKKLKAGYYFTFDLSIRKFETKNYWDLPKGHQLLDISYDEAKIELKRLLMDATSKRMISDVPLGIFLSGGIDSSLVAAIAQTQSHNPIKTFCVKFDEKNFDESIFAEKIASHLGTNHTTIHCKYDEGISLIENFYRYYDEPFGDGSAIPTMLLAKNTRKYVTVALSGDGGDESFMGYTRYQWMQKFRYTQELPLAIRNLLAIMLKSLPVKRIKSAGNVINLESLSEIYKRMISSPNKDFLINASESDIIEYSEWLTSNKNLLESLSNYDIKTYLNNDINTKVDRATMAFSLESRAPLMDYRIVDFSRRIPTLYKIKNGNKKRILKDILYEYVPIELLDRPKKGFGMPLEHWFRKELKEYVLDNLTNKTLSDIPNLNVAFAKKAIELHMEGKFDYNVLIWDLLVMVQWMKMEYR